VPGGTLERKTLGVGEGVGWLSLVHFGGWGLSLIPPGMGSKCDAVCRCVRTANAVLLKYVVLQSFS